MPTFFNAVDIYVHIYNCIYIYTYTIYIVYIICIVHHSSSFRFQWLTKESERCLWEFRKAMWEEEIAKQLQHEPRMPQGPEMLSWFNNWVVFLTVLQRGLASHNSVSDWAAKRGLHDGKHKWHLTNCKPRWYGSEPWYYLVWKSEPLTLMHLKSTGMPQKSLVSTTCKVIF